MMPLPADLNDKIFDKIRLNPGITAERLHVQLGGICCLQAVKERLGKLERQELIYSRVPPFSTPGRVIREFYVADYQPPKKKLFQPSSKFQRELKISYQEPSIQPSFQPKPNYTPRWGEARSPAAQSRPLVEEMPMLEPEPTSQPEAQPLTAEPVAADPRPDPRIQKVREAITTLQQKGVPFDIKAVTREAGVANGFTYRHRNLHAEVKAATTASQQSTKAKASDQAIQIATLTQRVQELEDSNRELRQQLGDAMAAQANKPSIVVETPQNPSPLGWLEAQARIWGATVARLQADADAAKANLEACVRLYDLERDRTDEFALNGNGKARCAEAK
jgi:Family of unknown function (DUF6262)